MKRYVSILILVIALLLAATAFRIGYISSSAQTGAPPLISASPLPLNSPSPSTITKPDLQCQGCHASNKTLPYLGGALFHTVPHNAYDIGLFGIHSSITAENLLISNCGKNLVLAKGGDYQFLHATMASISTDFLPHKEQSVYIADYLNNGPAYPLSAFFQNCILWGETNGLVKNEVIASRKGTQFSLSFQDVLWRVETPPAPATIVNAINTTDPGFEGIPLAGGPFNFRLAPGSPAINKGSANPLTIDLDGLPRPVGQPDLGAYEKQ